MTRWKGDGFLASSIDSQGSILFFFGHQFSFGYPLRKRIHDKLHSTWLLPSLHIYPQQNYPPLATLIGIDWSTSETLIKKCHYTEGRPLHPSCRVKASKQIMNTTTNLKMIHCPSLISKSRNGMIQRVVQCQELLANTILQKNHRTIMYKQSRNTVY